LTAQSSIFYEPKNVDDLSCFFRVNNEKYHEIWVILTKKTVTNPQPVSFNEAVAKAIEQGLMDSRTKTLDEKKYVVRFTKRKK